MWLLVISSHVGIQICCASFQFAYFLLIGQFRFSSSLCFKVRLSVKPLIWKWVKLIFTNFHNKGFVLILVLKEAVFGTWKWPISTRKTTISIYYCLLRLIRNLNLKLVITKVDGVRATKIESQNALLHCYALPKFYVTDSQNTRDLITSDRRSKRAWSNCVLGIPFILSGSPNDATYMQCIRNNNLDIRIAGSSCRLQQCAIQNNFTHITLS